MILRESWLSNKNCPRRKVPACALRAHHPILSILTLMFKSFFGAVAGEDPLNRLWMNFMTIVMYDGGCEISLDDLPSKTSQQRSIYIHIETSLTIEPTSTSRRDPEDACLGTDVMVTQSRVTSWTRTSLFGAGYYLEVSPHT